MDGPLHFVACSTRARAMGFGSHHLPLMSPMVGFPKYCIEERQGKNTGGLERDGVRDGMAVSGDSNLGATTLALGSSSQTNSIGPLRDHSTDMASHYKSCRRFESHSFRDSGAPQSTGCCSVRAIEVASEYQNVKNKIKKGARKHEAAPTSGLCFHNSGQEISYDTGLHLTGCDCFDHVSRTPGLPLVEAMPRPMLLIWQARTISGSLHLLLGATPEPISYHLVGRYGGRYELVAAPPPALGTEVYSVDLIKVLLLKL